MALPDNRIRIQSSLIDFDDDVGTTGQDHDSFPEPGPARYDTMRMFLIGLLAHQASYDEPTNFRKGTIWLDLNTFTLSIRSGDGAAGTEWSDLSDAIQVSSGLSLKDWFDAVSGSLAERLVSSAELAAAIGTFFTADVSGNITSFIMAAPNGDRYRVTMSNTGEFVRTKL